MKKTETRKVLVFEDNPQHMSWVLDLLEKRGSPLGYKAKHRTTNWKHAIQLLRDHSDEIDIAIVDLQETKTMKFVGFDIIR